MIQVKGDYLCTQTCQTLRPHGLKPSRHLCPRNFLGKNTEWVTHLLQGIFLTERPNLHLLHWQVGSLPMSHNGSPSVQFSSVQLLSRVRLFATPWIATCQASLSITNSRSSLRLTPIESVMPSSSSLVIPFFSCPNPSQHQSLFQWVNSSHEVVQIS